LRISLTALRGACFDAALRVDAPRRETRDAASGSRYCAHALLGAETDPRRGPPDQRDAEVAAKLETIGALHRRCAANVLPIFLPSVEIGGRHYGDGSIRNTAPLSPAINLGADRIIAIVVPGPPPAEAPAVVREAPTIARIAGVVLDAVMLDANTSVIHSPTGNDEHPFRRIDVPWLRPSALVRELAAQLADHIPPIVRYLMRGLGPDESITELASYLLFDSDFCGRLIDLGREDVAAERERIAAFLA